MSFTNVHRRSNTTQQSVEQWRSNMTTDSGSLPSWRHRRANSAQASLPLKPVACLPPNPLLAMQKEKSSKQASEPLLNKARQGSSTIESKRHQPTKSIPSLPPIPTSNVRGSRADKVDNWRIKSSTGSASRPSSRYEERRQSTDSLRSKMSEAPSSSGESCSEEEEAKTPKEEQTPQMLPPIRVSMEPGPVEVLPPLRFSMEPAIKGRSPWRFVLPSPKATVEKASFDLKADADEEEGEVTITSFDDLPYWLEGNRDDLIIRMGTSPLKRPHSPSERSSASSIASSEPALDYGDDCSSLASSASASPDLAPRQLDFGLPEDEDNDKTPMAAKHEFALPSFSAAAPLPSHLPLPSFLLRK
ncbi:uncharacterized protein FA14DRAFT_155104 [Meira miltonrushii]|uniref:Uncharacterized protein n=1 Tax=Meira miltonrushii TaxID=1280837 RepID=A0A316VEG6_9BASI|nr:uncharacterized protein FA14DRAFT_155104 [Meira miltonrushii]PWN35694.1 hypothetical protein FA14DRAFT_155104 [Meira miltonrushii]